MMKKLCIFLALALALMTMPAMAAEGDALLGHSSENSLYFNYCFAAGDLLYAVGYNSLYTYRLGDADLVEYAYDLPYDEDGVLDFSVMPFVDGDKLYALEMVTRYGEPTEFQGAKLTALTLREDNTVGFEDICDVDWSDLVEYYEDSSYASRPDGIVGVGGKAILRCYDNNGNGYCMFSVNLTNGNREMIADLRDAYAMTAYKDGTLLVEVYNYEKPETAKLMIYDPAGDSIQLLVEFKVENYSPLSGLAYDSATDTLYCIKGGEICPVDIQTGEILEGVAGLPLENYGNVASACVMDGGYFVYCSDGVAIRNLDPAQKAEIRLKICDNSWNDAVNNAFYRFDNAHGDIETVLSREYSEIENLIQSMMNRDDSIDVYVMSASTSTFEALYNRGYLMELDGSEKLNALAESMYPTLREALSTNGHLVAVPISAYAYTIGVNPKTLEKLGHSIDEVPDNWPEFLDFLNSLADDVKATNGKVQLFYAGYTVEDARNDLFLTIFEDYQRYVNHNDPAMGYNTEMLRGIVQKLEQLDLVALGCIPEAERDEYSVDDYEYNEDSMLLQTGTGCSIGNFYSTFTPILMGMAPGEKNPLSLETTVAFVNPFTKHPDVAMAFMEELVDNLTDAIRYCIDPTLSEPVRGKWYDEAITEYTNMLDELNRELESADPADKQMIEDSIEDTKKTLEYYDEFGWDVGPRDIEWYRANDADITIAKANWLYNDESGEAWDLINQYRDGQITAEELLAAIDRKVQMMLLEGN